MARTTPFCEFSGMTTLQLISAPDAPAAIGPYAHAVEHAGLIYSSGQIPLDPVSGAIVGDTATEQTRQVLANLAAVLAAAGSGPERILKTTIYLTDLSDFAQVNEVYADFMGAHRPARSTVQVAALPKGARVEIDVIAARRS